MRKSRIKASLALATAVAAAGSLAPSRALPGVTALASVTTAGAQANGPTPAATVPDTTSPQMSLDGLSVAFSSDASNLVTGDTNHVSDVFVRTLTTGVTKRVSLTSTGKQANGPSYSPSLNVYADKVAFVSEATNLVSGDTNGVADVFVRNLKTGSISRVSVSASGAQANGASNSPFLSLFGEWVTFSSAASNLVSGDDNGLPDAFLRDTIMRKTTRMPAPALRQEAPATAEARWTEQAQISYEGRYVSYLRAATRNIPRRAVDVPGAPAEVPSLGSPVPVPTLPVAVAPALDPDAVRAQFIPSALDVFVLDRKTGKTTQVKVPSFGFPGTGHPVKIMSDHPVLSADARIIAFESWRVIDRDDALVRDPTDFKKILVYDRVVKALGHASVPTYGAGVVAPDGDSTRPTISAGGSVVAFLSDATNLVTSDNNGATDVFVRDAPARTTSRASLSSTGVEANAPSVRPSISYEGRSVVFTSGATNLARNDSNSHADVFWRDRQTNTPNRAPVLAPIKGIRQVNQGELFELQLKATDADRDVMTYGVLVSVPPTTGTPAGGISPGMPVKSAMPPGSTIEESTGLFSWTPTPQQYGPWFIVFWVSDPRGNGTWEVAQINVRNTQETLECKTDENC